MGTGSLSFSTLILLYYASLSFIFMYVKTARFRLTNRKANAYESGRWCEWDVKIIPSLHGPSSRERERESLWEQNMGTGSLSFSTLILLYYASLSFIFMYVKTARFRLTNRKANAYESGRWCEWDVKIIPSLHGPSSIQITIVSSGKRLLCDRDHNEEYEIL
ncbi:hypothetical protein C4D60_Mb06t02560 [Musa balbisiana]|uniref:Uncharacterized protein n=1 Tax=Musa balbisiana TaxID=52838 RepID=A0A4S8ILE5_MUSBA|nr:hypothetical protein C4D60_Mb06t02560 [Musa balbisiana]